MIVVENKTTQDNFLKAPSVIFRCQKYVKKGYIEMTKKIYLETFKGCTRSLCFPLLIVQEILRVFFQWEKGTFIELLVSVKMACGILYASIWKNYFHQEQD